MALTDRPWRCKSRIMTSSPSLITASSLPPAEGPSVIRCGRPAIPGMPGMAGSHENWGNFKCHKWGELLRHSHGGDYDIGGLGACERGSGEPDGEARCDELS